MFYGPEQKQELGAWYDTLLSIAAPAYKQYVEIKTIQKAKAQATSDLKQIQEIQKIQEQARAQQAAVAVAKPKVFGIDQNMLLIAGGILAVGLLLKRR